MKVYIVVKVYPYEGMDIEEVYINEDKAKKHVDDGNYPIKYEYYRYYIRELIE